MNMTFLPKTHLGKWSTGLFIISLLFIIVASIVSFVQEPTINETFYNRLAVNMSMITSFVVMLGSFIFGIVSIKKSKEHSIFVYITLFFGFVMLIFLFADLIFSP
jgi:hypothetical protein